VLGTKTGFHLYQLHQSRGLRHVCANHDGPIAALHVLSPHIKIGDNPSSIALSAAVMFDCVAFLMLLVLEMSFFVVFVTVPPRIRHGFPEIV
jgi:hypothetical protein